MGRNKQNKQNLINGKTILYFVFRWYLSFIILIIAANDGNIDVVKKILSKGVSIETEDNQKCTPLNIGLF